MQTRNEQLGLFFAINHISTTCECCLAVRCLLKQRTPRRKGNSERCLMKSFLLREASRGRMSGLRTLQPRMGRIHRLQNLQLTPSVLTQNTARASLHERSGIVWARLLDLTKG